MEDNGQYADVSGELVTDSARLKMILDQLKCARIDRAEDRAAIERLTKLCSVMARTIAGKIPD